MSDRQERTARYGISCNYAYRLEAKIDALLRMFGDKGESIVCALDQKFLRLDGHAQPHGQGAR